MKYSNQTLRFFINADLSLTEINIADTDVIHQTLNVLRLKSKDKIVFLDDLGKVFHGRIKILSKQKMAVERDKIEKFEVEKGLKIKIVSAILKKDKLEYLWQKCTELGVSEFHPILSDRTQKINLNFDRARKIIKEAAEQSEKIFLPKIFEIKTLENFLKEHIDEKSKIFVLEFNQTLLNISDIKKNFQEVFILVGPEGGWGETDLKLFEQYKLKKVSLGKQILRAETASIAVSSLLLLGK